MGQDAESLHAKEEKRESYVCGHACQHFVTMTKYFRQLTYKEERLILAHSSGESVVRQHTVAGAYDRTKPFFSRWPGSEGGRLRGRDPSVLFKGHTLTGHAS